MNFKEEVKKLKLTTIGTADVLALFAKYKEEVIEQMKARKQSLWALDDHFERTDGFNTGIDSCVEIIDQS